MGTDTDGLPTIPTEVGEPDPKAAPSSPFHRDAVQRLTVHNARDLAEALPGEIGPGRVLRCACPLTVPQSEAGLLRRDMNIWHMIDLRSDDERKTDAQSDLLKGAKLLRYSRDGSGNLVASSAPPQRGSARNGVSSSSNGKNGASSSSNGRALSKAPSRAPGEEEEEGDGAVANGIGIEQQEEEGDGAAANGIGGEQQQQEEEEEAKEEEAQLPTLVVHQIALLNKTRYFTGLMWRISPLKWGLIALLGLVDTQTPRKMLINRINDGGLDLLYEILLETSKPEICTVLKVLTSCLERGHNIAFFCKVGKDRTGIIACLVLLCAGASKQQVIDDYHRSDEYHAVALGGLESDSRLQGLDWDLFSRAPAEVMHRTLAWVGQRYGSPFLYMDDIGFNAVWRRRLAAALKA